MLSRNPESYDVVRYITFIELNGYEKRPVTLEEEYIITTTFNLQGKYF